MVFEIFLVLRMDSLNYDDTLGEDTLGEEISDLLALEEEDDYGDREHKRSMIEKSSKSRIRLEAQMRFRVTQGGGECRYFIGIEDDGKFFGLSNEEHQETLKTIREIALCSDYSVTVLQTISKEERLASELLIRENNASGYIEIRVVICGCVDAGKSSSLGCLISGEKDNGKGSSRLKVANFKHEKEGNTSSVSQQVLGYDPEGRVVNHNTEVHEVSWKDIVLRSSKVISFFDLPGHEMYYKSAVFGVTSNKADFGIVVVEAGDEIKRPSKKCVNGMEVTHQQNTIEHIRLLKTHKIPVIILMTKIDRGRDTSPTLQKLRRIFSLGGASKPVVVLSTREDVLKEIDNVNAGAIVPVLEISNTTLQGHDLVHFFFNILNKRITFDTQGEVEFHVSNVYRVKGVGTVVGGLLHKGTVKEGNSYYFGPYNHDPVYKRVKIRSIEVKRTKFSEYKAGEYVCLSVPSLRTNEIKKGMILLDSKLPYVKEFLGEIRVLNSQNTTLKEGRHITMNINSLRTTVLILGIENKKQVPIKKSSDSIALAKSQEVVLEETQLEKNQLFTGDQGFVRFRLIYTRAYFKPGDRFSLVENILRATGIVREVF